MSESQDTGDNGAASGGEKGQVQFRIERLFLKDSSQNTAKLISPASDYI